MRIVQLTDLHVDVKEPRPRDIPVWEHLEWALRSVAETGANAVLVTGDLAFRHGTRETYSELALWLDRLPCDYLVMPGNHDDRSVFADIFGRRYRTTDSAPFIDRHVDIGGVPMVMLDTGDGEVTVQQLLWLDSVLSSCAAAARTGQRTRYLTVWCHHPILTGFHRYMDANYPLAGAAEAKTILDAYAHDLDISIFCGHYHWESHLVRGGIHQYCTPSLYMQIDPTSETFLPHPIGPGYRVVEICPGDPLETAVVYRPDESADPNVRE